MKLEPQRVALWLGTGMGFIVILYLLRRYDPQAVLLPILQSDIRLLAAIMALLAAVHVINAVSPVVLLGPPAHGQLSWWSRTRAFLAMQPLALFAPGRFTDFGALPLLSKHHKPGALASSIVLDRLVTLFFLLLLTPLALRFVWPGIASPAIDLAAFAALVLVGSTPFLLMNRQLRNAVNRSLLRLWPSLLQGFGAHIESLLLTSRARLLANLGLTLLKALLGAATIVLLARNVGVSLELVTALWMSVLIQLATAVPVAIQGLGVAEASLVLLFSVNGLPEPLALSMGVTARVLAIPVLAVIYLTTTVPVVSERVEAS